MPTLEDHQSKSKLFIDLETSGLAPSEGHIILSAGFLFDEVIHHGDIWKRGNTLQLVVYRKPTDEEWSKASPEALAVNGHTWDELQEKGLPAKEFKLKIISFIYESVFLNTSLHIGQNPIFDRRFLDAMMRLEMPLCGFPPVSADVIELAKMLRRRFPGEYKFENFKGWGIARAIGVEEEDSLHTALGGVEAVKRNYYKILEKLGVTYD